MKEIFYKKVGRKYVPVSEYDSELLDAYTQGAHLVVVKPGSVSKKYNIDPSFAPMIAAGRYAEDAMAKVLSDASSARVSCREVTPEQQLAWDNLKASFGGDLYYYEYPSTHEAIQAGVTAMQKEADKLLENPAVKKSYENFLLLCKLSKEY
jgi:hypothetical protein